MTTKTNNSLPLGFEKLKTEKPYVNLGKLAEGEYKFRIVQRPIAGWIDWHDKKPMRFKPDKKPKTSFDPTKPVKPFWAVYVWDYAKDGLFVMEITQNSIRRSLETLALNEDWGDLTTFDFKIKKEGAGIDTNYSVIPIPPKPVTEKIKQAVDASKVRLEALYEGKDPWNDLDDLSHVVVDPDAPVTALTHEQENRLDFFLGQIKDVNYLKKLNQRLNIDIIYKMDPKHFERVVKELESKVKEVSNVATKVA